MSIKSDRLGTAFHFPHFLPTAWCHGGVGNIAPVAYGETDLI